MNDERKTYNGWTNYETWVVKLWLDNEEPSYRYWTEEARNWKRREDAAVRFADQLQEEVTEGCPVDEASLYADLMNAALGEVDWYEIAESYLDDVEPSEDEDGSTDEEDSCDGDPMPNPTPERRREEPTTSNPGEDDLEAVFGPVISRYTRAQAIADGVLVDVSETAKEAGFRLPVALTRAVWAECVSVPEGVACQDEAGRLWDVLFMGHFGIRRGNRDASEIAYPLHVRNDNRAGDPPLVTLKAVCGPADDGSPCITIMLPDED